MASFTYTAPPSVTDIWNTNISAYSSAGFAGTYLKNAMPTFTYTAPPTVAQIWQTDVSGFSTVGQAGTYLKNAMPTFTYTAPPTVAQIWQTDVSGFSTVGQAGTYLKNAMPTFTYTAPPTLSQIWTYDISAISTSGQAGRYITDTAVDASNTASSVATIQASTTVIESIAYKQSMADYLLGRNLAGGSDGGRMVKDALRALRNKSEIVGSTLTVYTENDTSTAWTAAVSSSGSAVPVTGIDPA
jgi:hypothetical protein